jgi:sulfite reductase (NADPH) flavoprotein alpha-component
MERLSAAADRLAADARARPMLYAAVGLPALYLLTRGGKRKGEDLATDFNSFLKAPSDEPAGVPAAPLATDFNSFLKAPAPVYRETDFQSFLKAQPASAGTGGQKQAPAKGAAAAAPAAAALRPDQVKLTVMYGTEYGFSKEVAERLVARLAAIGAYFPELHNMADHPEGLADLAREQAVFMVCSTQGDGVPPTEAREFCDWLTGGKAAPLPPTLAFSVCALGDRSYEHFCRCGKTLDAALERAGAKRVAERADVNKEDYRAVDAWIDAVVAALPGLKLKSAAAMGLLTGAAAVLSFSPGSAATTASIQASTAL